MEKYLKEFRKASLKQLKDLKPGKICLFENEKIPENYTIVARLNIEIIQEIEKLIKELKTFDKNQFYYPVNQFHLTIIGNINIKTNQNVIINAIKETLPKYKMRFTTFGVGSNEFCSSISAYPIDFSMHELRKNLRNFIGEPGEDFTIHLSEYENMGWVNFLRYFHTPSQKFLDALYSLNSRCFGKIKPAKIELYQTASKVLNPGWSKLIFSTD